MKRVSGRIVAMAFTATVAVAACGTESEPVAILSNSVAPDAPELERPEASTVDAQSDNAEAIDEESLGAETGEGTSSVEANGDTRAITMSFTGDTLAHSPLWTRANENAGGSGYDFFPMFAEIAPTIAAADVATCHLETPIAPEGEEFTTDPLYGVPPEIVGAMAQAGFDRCSTASNHVLDRGVTGIDRTVEVLLANDMGQVGMARDELESLPAVFDVNGITIGHLSYTYATNGIPVPPDQPWRTGLIDPVRIVRDARSARDLGAEVVVVSLHWGTERVTEPDALQLAVGDEITASGAVDLVIGHHAHVVQPITQVNGVWVAYGLGNILSNLPTNDSWPAASQDAVVVEFDVEIDAAGTVAIAPPRVIPTWVDKQNGWVIRNVAAELRRDDIDDSQRQQLEASFERTAGVLGDYISG